MWSLLIGSIFYYGGPQGLYTLTATMIPLTTTTIAITMPTIKATLELLLPTTAAAALVGGT